MRIYLAGKIAKNDWRHDLVVGLSNAIDTEATWDRWPVLERCMIGGHDYTGPFFISDDHGSAHGSETHGVDASGYSWISNSGLKSHDSPDEARQRRVVTICKEAIKCSDLVFAWLDDPTAYGTLVEIGYAVGVGVPVIVGIPAETTACGADPMWFAHLSANSVYAATSAREALVQALSAPATADILDRAVHARAVERMIEACESEIERKMLVALLAHFTWIEDDAVVGPCGTLAQQVDVSGYRLDFGIHGVNKKKIAVECDGHYWHDRKPEQAARDKARDRELAAQGWTVLRFTGSEINSDPHACARQAVAIALDGATPKVRLQRIIEFKQRVMTGGERAARTAAALATFREPPKF